MNKEFEAIAHAWAPLYRFCETTYLAINARGTWELAFTRNVFSSVRPTRELRPNIETRLLRAGQMRVELQEGQVAEAITQKVLDSGTVTFPDGAQSVVTTGPLTGVEERYDRFYPATMTSGSQMRYPTLSMIPRGIEAVPISKDLVDIDLLANSIPFESYEDLAGFFGFPFSFHDFCAAKLVKIILDTPIIFGPACTIENNEGSIEIGTAKKFEPSDLLLTIKAFPENGVVRREALPVEKIAWEEKEDGRLGKIRFPLPDTPVALVIASQRGEYINRYWITDPGKTFNSNIKAHRLIDPDNSFVSKFFSNNRDEDFEQKVTLLLSLLGLRVFHYGRIGVTTDGVDILAMNGANLYAIECTIGDVDNKGKIQKLRDRVRTMQNEISTKSIAFASLTGVIVTTLPKAEASYHRAKLANFRIALVCKEDLEQLLNRLDVPPSAEEAHRDLLALIPSVDVDGVPATAAS